MVQNTQENAVQHHGLLRDDGTGQQLVHPNYQVIKAISMDSSGILYRGRSITDGRVVAIKVFSEASTPALVAHYDNDLHLDNLIGVKEVLSSNNGLPIAVMDMPGGACLEKVLVRNGKLPMAAAVHIALNVSLIIRAIHMLNETHGHVNSQNVFLKRQSTGRIRVQVLHHRLVGRPSGFNLPCFLSPELISENDVLLPADDNWAIAALLYHMLFGAPPFSSEIRDETARRILTEKLFLPNEFEQRYDTLASFLRRSLSKEMNERPSGREMNLELKSLLLDLRGKPDSVAPGNVAPEVDCIETPGVELPRSVPAESFVDNDVDALKDTLPEPVMALDASLDAPLDPHLVNEGNFAVSRESISHPVPETNDESCDLFHDPSMAFHAAADIDETPILGSAPVEDKNDSVAVNADWSGTSLISVEPMPLPSRVPEQDVVVESSKRTTSQSASHDSVQVVHGGILVTQRERRSRILIAAVIAAGLIVFSFFLVVLVFLRSDTGLQPEANSEDATVTNGDAGNLSDLVPAPPLVSGENVTITLKGLPSRARITLNGMRVEPPLIVPKSDKPIAIQAIVGNRIIFSATVLPTESQTYHVVGQQNKAKRRRQKK